MNPDYLDFEQPIADLEVKINELRLVGADNKININEEIAKLEDKSRKLTEKIFSSLSPWQIAQLARHPLRPYTEDYIQHIFTDFDELHGDRYYGDDPALIGGVAYLENKPVMIIGHQKGRSTTEKVRRNFGMPKPEGYRKARRLMLLAERYKMPVLTFIDTPGAYPGIDSESRGINEAIAENLALMSRLRTPIIATVTGEGNSGGAIAIGVCDQLNMLQYATYFVISPEGCATILWKSADYKDQAAEAMGVTSERLGELGIVDQIIQEPLGGAHRNLKLISQRIKEALIEKVTELCAMDVDTLLQSRHDKLMSYGSVTTAPPPKEKSRERGREKQQKDQQEKPREEAPGSPGVAAQVQESARAAANEAMAAAAASNPHPKAPETAAANSSEDKPAENEVEASGQVDEAEPQPEKPDENAGQEESSKPDDPERKPA